MLFRSCEGGSFSPVGGTYPREKIKAESRAEVMLFLFTRLNQKSNRDVEVILALLGTFGVDVSYKTIERLYSDEEVELVLHS